MKEVEMVVEQYRTVVRTLDIMFTELDRRSYGALWKTEGPLNGVGSCAGITTEQAQEGLTGSARNQIIELRSLRGDETPGSRSLKSGCDFHRQGKGCSLGDLKSPLCISHIDDPWELGVTFGVNGFSLDHDIRWILSSVLLMRDPYTKDKLTAPEENDAFVQDACNAIGLMTNHFKKFAIL